jgi:hypothetical protein
LFLAAIAATPQGLFFGYERAETFRHHAASLSVNLT